MAIVSPGSGCHSAPPARLHPDRAKVYVASGGAAPWTRPIATAIDFGQTAFRAAIDTGDLTDACLSVNKTTIAHLLVCHDPLDVVWRELDTGPQFVQNKVRYRDAADIIISHQRFIATMQGRTATFSTFSDAQFDQAVCSSVQFTERVNGMTISWYWIVSQRHCQASTPRRWRRPTPVTLSATALQRRRSRLLHYIALTLLALMTASADDHAWR